MKQSFHNLMLRQAIELKSNTFILTTTKHFFNVHRCISTKNILPCMIGKRSPDDVDIYVVDTDYSSYAILVFKRGKKITMKLYGKHSNVCQI